MSQITLRNIPEILDVQLRSLAHKNKKSLNKVILALLMKELGISENNDQKKRDLSDLCGTWNKQQYEELQEYIKEVGHIILYKNRSVLHTYKTSKL